MKKIGVALNWTSIFIMRHPMQNMLNWNRPENTVVNFFFGEGWCSANRHNNAVEQAMDWGADYIVFGGCDHICERDYLVKLVAHLEDGWDMATGFVPSRGNLSRTGGVFQYMAYIGKDLPGKIPGWSYEDLATTPRLWKNIRKKDTPSQEINCIGSGCLALKRKVFETVERPWFKEYLKPDNINYERTAINDTSFVFRATYEHGFRLWLDTTIDICHLDLFAIDETYEARFQDKTGEERWHPIDTKMGSGKY